MEVQESYCLQYLVKKKKKLSFVKNATDHERRISTHHLRQCVRERTLVYFDDNRGRCCIMSKNRKKHLTSSQLDNFSEKLVETYKTLREILLMDAGNFNLY